MKPITPIELEIFKNRINAICEEMGVVLGRSAFSPNIKERKDYSCALFDSQGEIIAQAAHIPVHLGSMPMSVKAAVMEFPHLAPGDAVILNDPYRGGTHLPDITLVSPVFLKGKKHPNFFTANRAHHADVGGKSPGSMALATRLEDEGVVIPPTLFKKRGRRNEKFLKHFLARVRVPEERLADLSAQDSANELGAQRLVELVAALGSSSIGQAIQQYRAYEEKITRLALAQIPNGKYFFEDFLEDDGISDRPIPIRLDLQIGKNKVRIDFSRSSPQVAGPVNATQSITYSVVAYVFRCLVNAVTGEDCVSMKPFQVLTRKGSVVDARYPAPVAGGNVETSQRIVDVLLGALSKALPNLIPAASQGTMNNLAFGSDRFTYYETLAGGSGASSFQAGASAVHTHMTNTLNTPIEALESSLPLRIRSYRIRPRSGGLGKNRGGDGLIREYEFLTEAEISILSERRKLKPWGLQGGQPGRKGVNWLIRKNEKTKLPGKCERKAERGDRIRIETPSGGGWGKPLSGRSLLR
jgi:N-methylhydantoinase B